MRDPYDVLGVPRQAGAAEIKKAFRRLAKTHHPDRNPDDVKAKERFAEISGAYGILGDEEKRGQFDRGEIDAQGRQRFQDFGGFGGAPGAGPGGFGRGAGAGGGFEGFTWSTGGGRAHPGSRGGAGGFSTEDILSDLFGGMGGRAGAGAGAGGFRRADAPAGEDVAVEVKVPFVDWALGGKARITLPTGRELDVKIPAGIEEGKTIRLKGQGMPSRLGGGPGDALVTPRIEPHPQFRADGRNVRVDVPITLYEAVLGGKVRVPTLDGAVDLNIPPRSTGGRTLRLKGRGIKTKSGHGDLLVTPRIILPDQPDEELEAFAERMRDGTPYDPRANGA